MWNQTVQPEVIPFWRFDGIFLMKKPSTKLPGEHYGVLISGEALRFLGLYGYPSVVVERTSEIRAVWAEETGIWQVLEQVPHHETEAAVARARAVFNDPNYYLLTNNCEHTARYIISGEKRSTQIDWYVSVGLVAAVATAIWSGNRRDD